MAPPADFNLTPQGNLGSLPKGKGHSSRVRGRIDIFPIWEDDISSIGPADKSRNLPIIANPGRRRFSALQMGPTPQGNLGSSPKAMRLTPAVLRSEIPVTLPVRKPNSDRTCPSLSPLRQSTPETTVSRNLSISEMRYRAGCDLHPAWNRAAACYMSGKSAESVSLPCIIPLFGCQKQPTN